MAGAKGNRNGVHNGKGWKRGRKRPNTPARQASQSANGKKPRNPLTKKAKLAIREAMQLGVIELLKGEILQKQVEVALGLHGSPGDWTRAAGWIGDRFGLPVQSISDVRMEAQVAPLIEFRQTAFERPGQEAKPKE